MPLQGIHVPHLPTPHPHRGTSPTPPVPSSHLPVPSHPSDPRQIQSSDIRLDQSTAAIPTKPQSSQPHPRTPHSALRTLHSVKSSPGQRYKVFLHVHPLQRYSTSYCIPHPSPSDSRRKPYCDCGHTLQSPSRLPSGEASAAEREPSLPHRTRQPLHSDAKICRSDATQRIPRNMSCATPPFDTSTRWTPPCPQLRIGTSEYPTTAHRPWTLLSTWKAPHASTVTCDPNQARLPSAGPVSSLRSATGAGSLLESHMIPELNMRSVEPYAGKCCPRTTVFCDRAANNPPSSRPELTYTNGGGRAAVPHSVVILRASWSRHALPPGSTRCTASALAPFCSVTSAPNTGVYPAAQRDFRAGISGPCVDPRPRVEYVARGRLLVVARRSTARAGWRSRATRALLPSLTELGTASCGET
jgi:hypothetical protein